MAFIKAQKVVRDGSGRVVGGSASVVDVSYVRGAKHHSSQTVRERLGRVVELAEDGRSGVFRSPTRGLVRYDADADEFAPVERGDGALADEFGEFPEPLAHVVAGDCLLLLSVLERSGLLGVLADAFPKAGERERLLCHLLHSVLKDGSRVSCDDFCARSAASHLLPGASVPSLRSDSAYFHAMGSDAAKVAFFRALVGAAREGDPSFGECCYIDSTPLPNAVAGNPFNALSCHGVGSSSVQCRLVLVVDSASGAPVWYDVVPGNVLDVSTLGQTRADVEETLGVSVGSAVLDSGYVNRELVTGGMRYLAKMPARRGYPFKTMYHKVKGQLGRGKYAFARAGHSYFGRAFREELFGAEAWMYVFVDRDNALSRLHQTLSERPEDYAGMKERDKDWEGVRGGFFVLVSNMEMTAPEALDAYFGRVEVESVFKTSKEHLGLLPLAKWTDTAIRGKILHDAVCTVALLQVRGAISSAGRAWSPSDLWGKTSSLMCFRKGGDLIVETASKRVRERFEGLGFKVPAKVDVEGFRRDVLGLGM